MAHTLVIPLPLESIWQPNQQTINTTQQTQVEMHNSRNTNLHFYDSHIEITIGIQILHIY